MFSEKTVCPISPHFKDLVAIVSNLFHTVLCKKKFALQSRAIANGSLSRLREA